MEDSGSNSLVSASFVINGRKTENPVRDILRGLGYHDPETKTRVEEQKIESQSSLII